MPLTIRPKIDNNKVPIEAEVFCPNELAGKTVDQIRQLTVHHGNRQRTIGECFDVHGDASDGQLVLEGDFARVKCIGQSMRSGSIIVRGRAGMHLGAEMRGGSIDVHGNAGDWIGAEMRSGFIRIRGNAGHLVGGSYRGSLLGMRGGTIVVEGSSGNEVGCGMRRGFIAVAGSVGDFAGFNMIAGTILVAGSFGIRTGAGMRRGSIIAVGEENDHPALLPTFRYNCVYLPQFLTIYFRQLLAWDFPLPPTVVGGQFHRYSGDLVALGKGEILIRKERGTRTE